MVDYKALNDAIIAADSAVSDVIRRLAYAVKKVKKSFAPEVHAAKNKLMNAEAALRRAHDEAAREIARKFISQRYREVRFDRWTVKIEGYTGREGVTEIFTASSVWPPSWDIPEIGETVLRILKKDGTPSESGVRRDSHHDGLNFYGWEPMP